MSRRRAVDARSSASEDRIAHRNPQLDAAADLVQVTPVPSKPRSRQRRIGSPASHVTRNPRFDGEVVGKLTYAGSRPRCQFGRFALRQRTNAAPETHAIAVHFDNNPVGIQLRATRERGFNVLLQLLCRNCALYVDRFVTPTTPAKSATASSAAVLWNLRSTDPSSTIQPRETLTETRC